MRWERESWIKLYRREVGSFALLPLYVRALAGELLKFADDAGRLYIGQREPWEAIAKLCGATTGDRRLLRQHIPLLIADKYLIPDGEYLVIRNLTSAQRRGPKPGGDERTVDDGEPDTNRERTGASDELTENESSTNQQRTKNEPARVVNEPGTKSELSGGSCYDPYLTGARASERVEESRGEERLPRPPSSGSAPADSSQVGLPWIGGQASRPVGVRQAKPPTETTAVWAVLREVYKLSFDGLEYQAKPDAADNAAIKRLTQDVGVVEAIRLIRAIYANQWVAKRYSKAKYLGDAQKLRAELATQARRDGERSQQPDPPPKTIILTPPPFPGLKPTTGEATAPAFPQFKPRPERARVVRESGA